MTMHEHELSTESSRIAERLSRCLGAATWEMDTFCRLAGVEASRDVSTAAVTCEGRPRLLVNPDFVASKCVRDEHLFLLAMHELWHVLLAHTQLYPRATAAQNIAFDAVINAGLARQFPGAAYRGFLEDLNPADTFPGLLLRPPVGWPHAPCYPDMDKPRGMARVLAALYPPPGTDWPPMPTYEDILRLLRRAGKRVLADPNTFLLGSHDEQGGDAETRSLDDPVLGSIVRQIVGKWPPPPIRIAGRDEGSDSRSWLVPPGDAQASARAVFAALLRRLLVVGQGGATERRRELVDVQMGLGVLPNARDRTAAARRRLGLPVTLWAQQLPHRLRTCVPTCPAHVYLDVSGSMSEVLPGLLDLLVPHVAVRRARTYQFSTEVHPLPLAELSAGRLRTTGGTRINPTLEHALAVPRLRRVVLVTDGYTGTPSRRLAAEITARRIDVEVVLPAESAWTRDLAGIARSITVLPSTVSR